MCQVDFVSLQNLKGYTYMSNVEVIQLVTGIGQIIAVAIIPIIVWFIGVKYQNRKAKKDKRCKHKSSNHGYLWKQGF